MSIVREYDDIGAFLREMSGPEYHGCEHYSGGYGASFYGAHDVPGAIEVARKGISKYNDRIQSLVDKVQCDLPTTEDVWTPSVAGVFPIVPAAIAGLPDNMLRREEVETTGVPLRIFVSCCVGANFGESEIAARGVAMCALLQVLSARRPVEMMLYGDMGNESLGLVSPIVRVQSMPLDTVTITAALTDRSFLRRLLFTWCDKAYGGGRYGYDGHWAHGMQPTDKQAQRLSREALGATPRDLVFHGGGNFERNDIFTDPVAWVQNQVKLTEQLQQESA